MSQYATATELAGRLQKAVDTYSANQVLTLASGLFDREAETTWSPKTVTWSTTDANGCTVLEPPFKPITAVSAVRVNGVAITGWVLRGGVLYRAAGFGYRGAWPPDQVDTDLTYGFTAPTDDVKAAILEIGAQAYEVPNGALVSETIDDWAVRYANNGGLRMTGMAENLAAGYRGVLIA
jgi:hypothetical protein